REVRAGRLADARAEAARPLRFQIHDVDLIERIARVLFLGLKDDLPAVGREVALASTDKIERQLFDIFKGARFLLLPGGSVGRDQKGGEKGQHQDRLLCGMRLRKHAKLPTIISDPPSLFSALSPSRQRAKERGWAAATSHGVSHVASLDSLGR